MSGARASAEEEVRRVLEFVDPSAVAAQATAARMGGGGGQTATRQRGGTGKVNWAANQHPRGFHGRFTVSQGQQQLKQSGQDPGAIDGKHGPKTTAALKAWQKQQGLTVTGRFDAGTVATMQAPPPVSRAEAVKQEKQAEAAAAKVGKSKAKTGTSKAASKRASAAQGAAHRAAVRRTQQGSGWQGNLSPLGVLRPGVGMETGKGGAAKRARGDAEVRLLQAKLQALGFDLGDGGVDGRYGDATTEAVKAFQRAHGLDVDGVVGRYTKMLLNLLGHDEAAKRTKGMGLSIDQMGLSEAALVAADATRELLEAKAKHEPSTPEERKALWQRFPEHAPDGPGSMGAFSLKRDSGGLFIHTHRARSKSYPTVAAIPKSVADFIESTG